MIARVDLFFVSDPEYTLGLWGGLKRSVADTGRFLRPLLKVCFVLGIVFILFVLVFPPMPGGIRYASHNAWMQTARQIGQIMFAYSTDHDGNYPDGNSSTEVFQKLLDEKYCADPTIFYIPLPGKIKPVAGQKLKPENVCWDVTSGVASDAPDGVPLIFMTGYKVTYAPGGVAVPIIKPYPQFGNLRTWSQWWNEGMPSGTKGRTPPGIAVFYKGNNAVFLILHTPGNSNVLIPNIPNFVPLTFDAKGKMYRQLTPDGPLPGN
jgi:type II secretory pathway pseudopilin PulG